MRRPWLSPWTLVTAAVLWLLLAPAWWNTLQDPDLWWQLWAGEELLAGRVPRTNGLSWTAPDQPWTSHEPLVALAYAAAGITWVGPIRGLILSATGALLARALWRPGGGWPAALAALWLTPMLLGSVLERALAWGNLLLAALTALLWAGRWPRRHAAAAALVALWSVVHGSFVLGLGMLALAPPAPGEGWRRAPAWAGLAGLLTLLIPGGLDRWGLILGYGAGTGPQALVHLYVQEWRPLVPPGDAMSWLLLGCVGLGLASALTAGGWRDRLLALAVGALALRHARYCAVLAIALLPLVVQRLETWLPARPLGRVDRVLAGALGLTGLAALLVRGPPPPSPLLWPTAILEEIPREPGLWSDFTLGAWHAREGIPAFWDSRNDCYPEAVLLDGLSVATRAEGWEAVLARWGVTRVLTRDVGLAGALAERGWVESGREGVLYLMEAP